MSVIAFCISEKHGCAYALEESPDFGDHLIHTPLNPDGTYSTNENDWCEVDELALLGEEQDIQDEIKRVWSELREPIMGDMEA